ncbi:MAG: PorT family protein [Paramuribaculum sp.]|nr:PorT family protein [Paramuribaculum sp.]
MKKIIFAFVAVFALAAAPAAKAQFRYGPMAGVSLTSLKFKQDLVSIDQTVGFSAGVIAEMMFPGIGFGIDLGLYFDERGANMNLGERTMWQTQGYGKEHIALHYVALPVHLRFKYTNLNGFEDILAPFAFAGPTFGIRLANSKVKAMEYSGGDLGLEFGIGGEILKRWQVSASYNMGMTYVTKAKILTNYSARSTEWSLRVAYLF